MKSVYKRHRCDQCGNTFEDMEFFAFFCSPDCLLGYVIENYYIPEGGTYEEIRSAVDGLCSGPSNPKSGSPTNN